MAHVFDYQTNNWVDLPDGDVTNAVASGGVQFANGRVIRAVDPEGKQTLIKAEEATQAFRNGYTYLSPAVNQQMMADRKAQMEQEVYGSGLAQVGAAVAGTARTLTFGGSDLVARGLYGEAGAEALRGMAEQNPNLTMAGELAGMVSPIGAAGRIGAGAIRAGEQVAGKIGASLTGRAIASTGKGIMGPSTQAVSALATRFGSGALGTASRGGLAVAQSAAKYGTAGAIEGALEGVRQSITDFALDKDEASIQNTIANVGLGAFLGGGVGLGLGGVGRASGMLGKAAMEWNATKGPGKSIREFVAKNYPKLFNFANRLKGENAEIVKRVFEDETLRGRLLHMNDNPDEVLGEIVSGFETLKSSGTQLTAKLGKQRGAIVGKMDEKIAKPVYVQRPQRGIGFSDIPADEGYVYHRIDQERLGDTIRGKKFSGYDKEVLGKETPSSWWSRTPADADIAPDKIKIMPDEIGDGVLVRMKSKGIVYPDERKFVKAQQFPDAGTEAILQNINEDLANEGAQFISDAAKQKEIKNRLRKTLFDDTHQYTVRRVPSADIEVLTANGWIPANKLNIDGFAGDVTTKPRAVVKTAPIKKSWDSLKLQWMPELEAMAARPDLNGGKQGRIIEQLMGEIDEKLSLARTPSEIHNAFRDSMTKMNQSFAELQAAKVPSQGLTSFRAALNDLSTSKKLWGNAGKEYRDVNKLFENYYNAQEYIFGIGKKKGLVTDMVDGKLVISEEKLDKVLKGAAQVRSKRLTQKLAEYEDATMAISGYLKRNPEAATQFPGIENSIQASRKMIDDLFFAKTQNVLFNRQQTFTGKVLQGPAAGLLAGGMVNPTVGAVAGLAGMALSNPKIMLRYVHGNLRADQGLSARTFNAVADFLRNPNVSNRIAASGSMGATYTMGRAARSMGEERKRNETDVEFLTRALRSYSTDPFQTETQVRSALWGMEPTMPSAYYGTVNTVQRAMGFLNSKLPPLSTDPFAPMENDTMSLSDEMKLQAYVTATWKPDTILAELRDGNIQPETVETVKAVYPEFYNEIQGLILDEITSKKPKLAYYQRLDLGLLFNMPSVAGLEDIDAIQKALTIDTQTQGTEGRKSPSRRSTSQVATITMAGSAGLQARRAT